MMDKTLHDPRADMQIYWRPNAKISLNGFFSPIELEAIAWYVRKQEKLLNEEEL